MSPFPPATPDSSGWYSAPIDSFLLAESDRIIGVLTRKSPFDVTPAQVAAWRTAIDILQDALQGLSGTVIFEFEVPRLRPRIDAVLVCGAALIPVEFKVGASTFAADDVNQAWDYALDLKNFHEPSASASIFPILVATDAASADSSWSAPHADGTRQPCRSAPRTLRADIMEAIRLATGPPIDGEEWQRGRYRPTPTIIEAAQALYSRHGVEAISRNDAGARNLRETSATVESIIARSVASRFKAIVFVTGVPGAGKTLVGLNLATRHRRSEDATHAVFLSGNGPLVAVLREALARDEHARLNSQGIKARKGDIRQPIQQFIQNIHHFRDDGVRTLRSAEPPHDRVVIFDEAQRAWNARKTANFMKQRKGLAGFDRSEPQFLIEYMDRHDDWAVIVCLVGGGQEINDGEAGIGAWLEALASHFPHWHVFISPELSDSEYAAGNCLDELGRRGRTETLEDLHLSVSMRSFRSEKLSRFVKAVLDTDSVMARELLSQIGAQYPMAVTRDLRAAKDWVRRHARGSERFGMVASSSALRLKPHAIDVRAPVDACHWFLNGRNDTRSSFYLEDAATEFQIQGLELDWICVNWDADLRYHNGAWARRRFDARGWTTVRDTARQQYLLNTYRVLLTRARQGMVIFIPPGDPDDPTRLPDFYDGTYQFLTEVGITPL